MKKFMVNFLCLILLLTLNACSAGGRVTTNHTSEISETESIVTEETVKEIDSLDCAYVLKILKDGGVPIINFIIFNEETDPNILEYGQDTELDYLEKANFADERFGKNYDSLEPKSGTIEIFSTFKEASDRADSLQGSDADVFSIRIISDKVLIRLSKDYTKEQAQDIADIVGGEIHSIDEVVELSEKFGDMLEEFQGEWKESDREDTYLIINGKDFNSVYYDTKETGRTIVDRIFTFYFDLDENGNIILTNSASQPRYNISLDENGILSVKNINGEIKERTYEKVSDNTELPEVTKDPEIGMTESEVCASTWGYPQKRNKTTTAAGVREQWVYKDGYIYFKDGHVTTIQEN